MSKLQQAIRDRASLSAVQTEIALAAQGQYVAPGQLGTVMQARDYITDPNIDEFISTHEDPLIRSQKWKMGRLQRTTSWDSKDEQLSFLYQAAHNVVLFCYTKKASVNEELQSYFERHGINYHILMQVRTDARAGFKYKGQVERYLHMDVGEGKRKSLWQRIRGQ